MDQTTRRMRAQALRRLALVAGPALEVASLDDSEDEVITAIETLYKALTVDTASDLPADVRFEDFLDWMEQI